MGLAGGCSNGEASLSSRSRSVSKADHRSLLPSQYLSGDAINMIKSLSQVFVDLVRLPFSPLSKSRSILTFFLSSTALPNGQASPRRVRQRSRFESTQAESSRRTSFRSHPRFEALAWEGEEGVLRLDRAVSSSRRVSSIVSVLTFPFHSQRSAENLRFHQAGYLDLVSKARPLFRLIL